MGDDSESGRTETIRIAIPKKIMDEIRTLVDDGLFINAGELMRSALLVYLARLYDVIGIIWPDLRKTQE